MKSPNEQTGSQGVCVYVSNGRGGADRRIRSRLVLERGRAGVWEDDGGQAGFEAVRWPHFPSVTAQLEVFVATTDPVAKEPGRGGRFVSTWQTQRPGALYLLMRESELMFV